MFTTLVTSRLKKISDYENIHSVNLCILEFILLQDILKQNTKYLIIDSTEKYEEVWSGITSKIKTLNGGKELFHEKKIC